MPDSAKFDTMLPYAAPMCGDTRIILYAFRRMATHGIQDAHAVSALMTAYGMRYRKPLLLLRALLIDIARNSSKTIVVAPCCDPRMTEHENALLKAINEPPVAEQHLSVLLDTGKTSIAAATTAALSESLAAMGRPLFT